MANIYKFVNASATGGGSSTPYTMSFDATTDWGAPSGGFYTMTILEATHGRGTDPTVQAYESVASDFEQVTLEIILNASGDVTLRVTETADARFAGKVIID